MTIIHSFKKIIYPYYKLSLRHSLISITCASAEFSLFLLLFFHLKFNLLISYFFSFATAFSIGLVGHTFITYSLKRISKKNFYFFVMQCLISFIFGYSIINFLLGINLPIPVAKAFQLIITFIFNLFFGKNLTFRNN